MTYCAPTLITVGSSTPSPSPTVEVVGPSVEPSPVWRVSGSLPVGRTSVAAVSLPFVASVLMPGGNVVAGVGAALNWSAVSHVESAEDGVPVVARRRPPSASSSTLLDSNRHVVSGKFSNHDVSSVEHAKETAGAMSAAKTTAVSAMSQRCTVHLLGVGPTPAGFAMRRRLPR